MVAHRIRNARNVALLMFAVTAFVISGRTVKADTTCLEYADWCANHCGTTVIGSQPYSCWNTCLYRDFEDHCIADWDECWTNFSFAPGVEYFECEEFSGYKVCQCAL